MSAKERLRADYQKYRAIKILCDTCPQKAVYEIEDQDGDILGKFCASHKDKLLKALELPDIR